MTLQFLGVEQGVLDSRIGQTSSLVHRSKARIVIHDSSMVAFSVIRNAANDPSTPLEKEVCSIDKLLYDGNALYAPVDETFVHHLPKNLLADAMMDFTRLTSDGYIKLVCDFCISTSRSALLDESADEILRNFFAPLANPHVTPDDLTTTELVSDDLLHGFHWSTLCDIKRFVGNALKANLEVLRLNA